VNESASGVAEANAASGTSGHLTAIFRNVSPVLVAQTISGNIKGQFLCVETAAGDNYTLAVAIKVIQADGTDRGVLLGVSASDDTSATPPEFATTAVNRRVRDSSENTSLSLSSLAVSDGDRIVIEVGFRQSSAATNNATIYRGYSQSQVDQGENDTDNTSQNPWVEFDSDIKFVSYYGSVEIPLDAVAAVNTSDPTAVTPPTGCQVGDLVCMIGQQRATGATLAVSATGGQTWTTETAIGTTNQTSRLFWCTFNGTWGANPSVDFSATTCNSVQMHVFRPPTTGYTWSINQAQVELDIAAAASGTITEQTTTGTNPTVTLAGWFTADDNTWGTLTGTGWEVTGTSQYRNTSGSDQSATYAHKIQTAAAATGNVTKTQLTNGNDAMTTFIVTFAATAPAVFMPRRELPILQATNRAAFY
jgi:hypothetical protein